MRNRSAVILLLVGASLTTRELEASETPPPAAQLELLKQNGIATDTDSLIAYLERLQPSAKLQEEIAALIAQLSSTNFKERETATQKLSTFGAAARAQLIEAGKSQDAEVAWRSGLILKQLDSGSELEKRQAITLAALEVLRQRGEAQAGPVLLTVLPTLDDPYMRDVACEALWASTDAGHAENLRRALASDNVVVQSAAIVALEIAEGEAAVEVLSPYFNDTKSPLRLAAARALADRQPPACVDALVTLVGDENNDIAWQADGLLTMLAGKGVELSGELTLTDAWRKWISDEFDERNLNVPLGGRRHDLGAGRHVLIESFERDENSLAKGYGRFLYEADNAGEASTAGGKLLIDGDNDEGDQRLYITSQRMIGRDQWPRELEVRAKLGGQEGNNFGWHLGVSVGRAKILFHPGLSGGAFRAETTDEHDYFFGNISMPFTPAADAIHEMIIRVKKIDGGGAEFDVTLLDGRSDAKFTRAIQVTREQLGDYNRIGLERSGRRGAAAMFESVSIRLGR